MSRWLSAPQFCPMFACCAVRFARRFKLLLYLKLHILLLPLFSMGTKSIKSAKDAPKSSSSLSSASPTRILCQRGTGVSTPQFARGSSRISTRSYLQMQIRTPPPPRSPWEETWTHVPRLDWKMLTSLDGIVWFVQTVSVHLWTHVERDCVSRVDKGRLDIARDVGTPTSHPLLSFSLHEWTHPKLFLHCLTAFRHINSPQFMTFSIVSNLHRWMTMNVFMAFICKACNMTGVSKK